VEGKSISGEFVRMWKKEIACSVNLVCRQSVTVSEENQI